VEIATKSLMSMTPSPVKSAKILTELERWPPLKKNRRCDSPDPWHKRRKSASQQLRLWIGPLYQQKREPKSMEKWIWVLNGGAGFMSNSDYNPSDDLARF
jgi:hypothetical protein